LSTEKTRLTVSDQSETDRDLCGEQYANCSAKTFPTMKCMKNMKGKNIVNADFIDFYFMVFMIFMVSQS